MRGFLGGGVAGGVRGGGVRGGGVAGRGGGFRRRRRRWNARSFLRFSASRARCTSANVARARTGAQSFCKPAARLAARTAATAAGVVGRWKRWSGGMAALPLRRGGSRDASRARGGSQRSGRAGEGHPAGVQQTPALSDAIIVVPAACLSRAHAIRTRPKGAKGCLQGVGVSCSPYAVGYAKVPVRRPFVLTQTQNVREALWCPCLPKKSGCLRTGCPFVRRQRGRGDIAESHRPDLREAAPAPA